jgi:OFA family oxalate/formate antiporter-like MFS transporter
VGLSVPLLGRRLFYGWVVIVAAWLAMFVCSASIASFSIFAPELEGEFGWTRGMLSLGYTINTITIAVFGLVAGLLADRIGLRRLVIIGAIVGGLGMALLSQIDQPWHFHLLFGVLAPAGISLCFIVPTVATVRRWFMRRAALAVAMAMTGSGLGVVILLPLLHRLIRSIGWSDSYIVLGLIMVVGASVGGLLLKKDPESSGTYPDGVKPEAQELEARADFTARSEKWSVREAFHTSSWWLFILSQFFNIAIIGIIGHIIFWGKDLGIPEGDAVSVLSFLVLAAVAGRLFAGFTSDWLMARFGISRKPLLYVCTIGVALGCFLAMGVSSETELLLVSLLIGFCYGIGLAVFPTYLGDLFGVVSVSALFGIAFLLSAGLFGSIGPVLYGFIHEASGSYDLAFMITAILCLVSAIALLLIKAPVKTRRDQA